MEIKENIECDSCGYTGARLTEYKIRGKTWAPITGNFDYDFKYLCDLCSSTMVSAAKDYVRELSPNEIGRTICYVGNEILKAIRELKETIK
jgi:hypothetical protein